LVIILEFTRLGYHFLPFYHCFAACA
jgi:hypothetical protein